MERERAAAVCGTPSGRNRHRRRGEPVCADCKAAHAKAERERTARLTAEAASADIAHGLPSTYQYRGCRCELCAEANRTRSRAASAKSRALLADRLQQCGTRAGASRHRQANEPLCAACEAIERRNLPTVKERFLACVEHVGGHWLWKLSTTDEGYGLFKAAGRQQGAHRWSYELFVGPIPDGLDIDHVCHSSDPDCLGGATCLHRRCVNPAHLEAVTGAENTRRGRSWNRAKTHCPAGHEYTAENTYRQPSKPGSRRCRKCHANRSKR